VRRHGGLLAALSGLGLAAASLAACPAEEKVPGELIGTFQFEVALKQDGCGYQQPTSRNPYSLGGRTGDPEPFAASLSLDPEANRFYLTSGATQLEGTLLDGGRTFEVRGDAKRRLPAPCSCNGTITERIEGSMFGEAQVAAGGCKAPAVEGGGPLLGDGGTEVRLACGFLVDEMSANDADAGCSCPPCLVVYEIAGARQ
jgi:hypothetical protein